jgi:hypothetical protein
MTISFSVLLASPTRYSMCIVEGIIKLHIYFDMQTRPEADPCFSAAGAV